MNKTAKRRSRCPVSLEQERAWRRAKTRFCRAFPNLAVEGMEGDLIAGDDKPVLTVRMSPALAQAIGFALHDKAVKQMGDVEGHLSLLGPIDFWAKKRKMRQTVRMAAPWLWAESRRFKRLWSRWVKDTLAQRKA